MKHSNISTTTTTTTKQGRKEGAPEAQEVMLKKISPAGGNGGIEFDSGCNLSGIKRISIECGPYTHHFQHYKSTIKRLYIEFNNNRSESEALFFGIPMDQAGNKTFTALDVVDSSTGSSSSDHHENNNNNNDIVKVIVWADDKLANAIQFHFASGEVSPRYGIPSNNAEPTTYCAGGEGSRIVGIYGRAGKVIDSIGFAFSKPNVYDWEKIPCSVGGGQTTTEIEEEDLQESPSIVAASVKGEELASIVSSLKWDD